VDLHVIRVAAVVLAIAGAAPAPSLAEPALSASQWSIVELGGKRVRGIATLNFTRLRWLGLETPCGAFWGWYRQSGPALKIHVTRQRYAPGPLCQGIDYQLLLGRVRSYQAEGDGLVFANEQGKIIARLARTK